MKLRKIAVAMALCVVMTACGTGAGDTPQGQGTVTDAAVSENVSGEETDPVQDVTDETGDPQDQGDSADAGQTEAADTEADTQNGTDGAQDGTDAAQDGTDTDPEPVEAEELTFITDAGTTTLNGYTVKPIPDNAAFEYIGGMGAGINLGNAFDASDCTWLTDELEYESAWCKAKTVPAYIDSLCNEGFNLIRIPVSWHNHVDKDYKISEQWLARVTEVVDYCLDKDMYVIINIHHDVDKDYFYPDSAHAENTLKYTETVWKQIAENFRDRSDRLIFECINEPRLKGTDNEWWFPSENAAVLDAYKTLMDANQCFVDTVRATGGNNADRYLMVCGYCHIPSSTVSNNFDIPSDTADNKIIVSVHSYRPYDFAGDKDGKTAFGEPEKRENKQVFSSLYDRYVANGIPVIIGEYGCTDKKNAEDRLHYYEFMGECSALYSIPIIAWDNNAFNNTSSPQAETFGLIDRATGNVKLQELVDAITATYVK